MYYLKHLYLKKKEEIYQKLVQFRKILEFQVKIKPILYFNSVCRYRSFFL